MLMTMIGRKTGQRRRHHDHHDAAAAPTTSTRNLNTGSVRYCDHDPSRDIEGLVTYDALAEGLVTYDALAAILPGVAVHDLHPSLGMDGRKRLTSQSSWVAE
jgi:hypothetical protein